MPDRIRTFIAVKIDATPPLRSVLKQLAEMGRAIKTVDADQLHVTLKFLGDTDLELIPEVVRGMTEAVSGISSFDVKLTGLGAFPRMERPTVIWAGLHSADPLVTIAEFLQRSLEPHGFPAEARRFTPHLTLARIKAKPPPELGEFFTRHASAAFGVATIGEVELMQSELTPEGPIYTRLSAVDFNGT